MAANPTLPIAVADVLVRISVVIPYADGYPPKLDGQAVAEAVAMSQVASLIGNTLRGAAATRSVITEIRLLEV